MVLEMIRGRAGKLEVLRGWVPPTLTPKTFFAVVPSMSKWYNLVLSWFLQLTGV